MTVTIKTPAEIETMRRAGAVVARCHTRVRDAIAPGVTTGDLDALVMETILANDATSSFLGHHGFTGCICASVNDEVVHGIPGGRRLEDGDIIAVDIGAIVDGFHGDSAWTYPVGAVSEAAARLLERTEAALWAGLREARAGKRLGDIGAAIERSSLADGLGIVEAYGGHGIGRSMWEDPHVPNLGSPGRGLRLRAGMTLAVEPMLTLGAGTTRTLDDDWTVVTTDGSWSAHFEHTLAIVDGRPDVLTLDRQSVVN